MVLWLGAPSSVHHPDRFGDHKHWDMKDLIIVICHVFEESCDVMSGSCSQFVTTLPTLVVIGIVVVEMKCL